jgi:hypothetical protein
MKELYTAIVTTTFDDGHTDLAIFDNRQDAENHADYVELTEKRKAIVDIHEHYLLV